MDIRVDGMVWLPLAGGVALVLLTAYCLSRRERGWRLLAVLGALCAFWSLAYVGELRAPDLSSRLLWIKLEYVGVALAPLAWLGVSLTVAGRGAWLTPRWWAALAIVPAMTIGVAWIRPSLIWSDVRLDEAVSSAAGFEASRGPWFYVHAIYGYGLLGVGTLVLLGAAMATPVRRERRQAAAVAAAALLPASANLVYLSDLTAIDWTPTALAASAVVVAFAIGRYRLIDLQPVAAPWLLDQLQVGVALLDSRERLVAVNRAFERIAGAEREELLGAPWNELDPSIAGALDRALEAGSREIEFRRSGSDREYALRVERATGGVGGGDFRMVVLRDVTERRQADDALFHSQERLRWLVEQLPGVLWTIDRDEVFTYSGGRGLEALGLAWNEVVGRTLEDYFGTDDPGFEPLAVHRAALRGDAGSYLVSWEGRWYESSVRPLRRADGEIDGVIGIAFDVTDRRLEEERSFRRERLESLGVLAGGVAHDFNNLLTAVGGACEVVRAGMAEEDRHRELMDGALEASRRAAELTEQLLIYTGQGASRQEAVELGRVVEGARRFLAAAVGEGIDLQIDVADPDGGGLWIQGDPVQLQQVLLNLVLNAAEAYGGEPGAVRIRCGRREILPEEASAEWLPASVAGDPVVFLSIRDEGGGMTTEVREHAFDPFFSTKEGGRGLGLASVLGIVRAHRGGCRVTTRSGEGTEVEIVLPLARPPQARQRSARETPRAPAPALAAGRALTRVLLVDDDDLVRPTLRAALESLGCEVVEAAGGREALEIHAEQGPSIDLVLLDVVMPDLRGDEVLRRIRRREPKARIVLMSGYTRHALRQSLADLGALAFLVKPFALDELDAILAQVRSSRGSSSDAR